MTPNYSLQFGIHSITPKRLRKNFQVSLLQRKNELGCVDGYKMR